MEARHKRVGFGMTCLDFNTGWADEHFVRVDRCARARALARARPEPDPSPNPAPGRTNASSRWPAHLAHLHRPHTPHLTTSCCLHPCPSPSLCQGALGPPGRAFSAPSRRLTFPRPRLTPRPQAQNQPGNTAADGRVGLRGVYLLTHRTHPCPPVRPCLQVLRTLVLCSFKATPAGGNVHITLAVADVEVGKQQTQNNALAPRSPHASQVRPYIAPVQCHIYAPATLTLAARPRRCAFRLPKAHPATPARPYAKRLLLTHTHTATPPHPPTPPPCLTHTHAPVVRSTATARRWACWAPWRRSWQGPWVAHGGAATWRPRSTP